MYDTPRWNIFCLFCCADNTTEPCSNSKNENEVDAYYYDTALKHFALPRDVIAAESLIISVLMRVSDTRYDKTLTQTNNLCFLTLQANRGQITWISLEIQ